MSGILVIAEHRRGELRGATLELVSAAQTAKRDAADTVTVALIADEPERLIPDVSVAGVDTVGLPGLASGTDVDSDCAELS